MKTTTKVIFGAALSVFSIAALSNQAWAAEITNVTGRGNIQFKQNPDDTSAVGVDHSIYKFDLNFSVNQAVEDGDYFDFETHALPDLGDSNILAGNGDSTIIGKITKINTVTGSRGLNSRLNTAVANWQNIRPEDNTKFKYRATFNQNAKNRQNLNFSINTVNGRVSYTIAAKTYNLEAWVKLGADKIVSKSTNVWPWSKEVPVTKTTLTTTTTVIDMLQGSPYNGTMWQTYSFGIAEDLKGNYIEVTLPQNSPVKFKDHQDSKKFTNSSNYRYDDNAVVNQYGMIFSSTNARWGYTGVELTDNKFKVLIDNQTVDNFRTGFWTYYELTESGKRAFAETGTLPVFKPIAKIVKPSGEVIFEGEFTSTTEFRGSTSEFRSTLQKEIEEIPKEEPKVEEVPEVKQEEIKAPDTGFEGGISALALSVFSLLGLATFFARKR